MRSIDYPIKLSSGDGVQAKCGWCTGKVGWCTARGYLKKNEVRNIKHAK